MLSFFKSAFKSAFVILLSIGRLLATPNAKCLSFNNQPRLARPTLLD